jgi:hypothetical protein
VDIEIDLIGDAGQIINDDPRTSVLNDFRRKQSSGRYLADGRFIAITTGRRGRQLLRQDSIRTE